jgi:hypothetical protein
MSVLLSMSGCARRVGEKSSSRIQADLIKGQIFIVTKGRENVRLGLVSVQAFSDSTILSHIASRRAAADTLRKAIQPQLDASLARARQRLEVATQGLRKANANAGAAETRMIDAHGDNVDPAIEALNAAREAIEPAQDLVAQRERELRAEAAAAPARFDGMNSSLDSGEFYLEGLPRPLTETKTDANGEFVIEIPSDRLVVLAAFAQRQVFDHTESYAWLIRVPVGTSRGDKLLLSNDNLTTANSPQSPLHTVK